MHYMYYAASKCMFWTEKQMARIDSWKDKFEIPGYDCSSEVECDDEDD